MVMAPLTGNESAEDDAAFLAAPTMNEAELREFYFTGDVVPENSSSNNDNINEQPIVGNGVEGHQIPEGNPENCNGAARKRSTPASIKGIRFSCTPSADSLLSPLNVPPCSVAALRQAGGTAAVAANATAAHRRDSYQLQHTQTWHGTVKQQQKQQQQQPAWRALAQVSVGLRSGAVVFPTDAVSAKKSSAMPSEAVEQPTVENVNYTSIDADGGGGGPLWCYTDYAARIDASRTSEQASRYAFGFGFIIKGESSGW